MSPRRFIDYMRQERQLSQRTIENTFSVLSSFYEYLTLEGHVKVNQVPSVRRRYLKRHRDGDDGHSQK